MTIPPSFVNEVTPDEMLSKTGPLVQMSTNVGLLFANGLALALPTSDYKSNVMNNWWFFMFGFPGLVAFYQFWFFWTICKYDSALWLLTKGRKEESLQSLSMVYTEEGIQSGLKRFTKSMRSDSEMSDPLIGQQEEQKVTFKKLLSEKKYRKMIRVGIMLAIIQQLSGINAGVFYSTSIFMVIGGSVFMARLYSFLTTVVFLFACVGSIPLLGRFGRTTLLISGQAFLAIDLVVMGVLVVIGNTPNILLVIGVMLLFVLFSYSLGSTLWLYLGEACIDKALGISATVNLICVCFVTGVFPVVVNSLGIQIAFFFFGGCMALGAVYSKFDLIETKDKSKSQVLEEMMKD
jgi:SP family arabinose:H+ symporter-like MFS transporter